jgi:L-fuculose-phosphate aldolase
MNIDLMHPRDQIVLLMNRIYSHGMTTTSGGNLSIMDEDRNIWISPAGIDKGTLRREDIMCVRADGTVEGIHTPSSEYPFHKAIYEARPDLHAILHAHPAALVAFSIARQVPETRVIPQAADICGQVGYAPYALPGSQKLGENIAAKFAEGFDCVLLEKHGVACGGKSMLHAYQRFESLDFCALLLVRSASLGKHHVLTESQIRSFYHNRHYLPECPAPTRSNKEKDLRRQIVSLVRRAYEHRIMSSMAGTFSARIDNDSFLITPTGTDRMYLEIQDVVGIYGGRRETGKLPSRAVVLHKTIYEQHPSVEAIVSAQAPNVMAFGVTGVPMRTRTIPESYLILRDIPLVPFGNTYANELFVARQFSPSVPVILLQNDAIVATGKSLLAAYDTLEVAEFTARSLLYAGPLGPFAPIGDPQIAELKKAFKLQD